MLLYLIQRKISISRIVSIFLVSFKNLSFCFLQEDVAFIPYSILSLCPSVDFNSFNFSHCELSIKKFLPYQIHDNGVFFCASCFNGSSIYRRLPEMKNEKPIYASYPVLMYTRNSGDSGHGQRLKLCIPVGAY